MSRCNALSIAMSKCNALSIAMSKYNVICCMEIVATITALGRT